MAIEAQLAYGVSNGVVYGFNVALMALGLTLIFGLMRIVNLAHGEFYMLGGVTAWFSMIYIGNFWLALLLAPLMVGIVGLGMERFILRPVEMKPEVTVIATLGVLLIIQQLALIFFGGTPQPVPPPLEFRISLFGVGYSGYRLISGMMAVAILAAAWFALFRTNFGLRVRAARDNPELALASGIPVTKVYSYIFSLGAALAALGGVLTAPITTVHYMMGLEAVVTAFMVVIAGGPGNLKGTIIAAILIGVTEGVGAAFLSPTEARVFMLILVVGVLLLRPRGILGGET